MELFELQGKIKTNKIPKFMIFKGEEYAIINLYIDKISKVLNRNITYIENASNVLSKNKAISLVDPNRLYVCRYDNSFMGESKIWENIYSKLSNAYLILVYTDIDKRNKFYKTFSKEIVDFGEQKEEVLKVMVKSQILLSDDNLNKLIESCSKSYSKCLLEIDKIINYAKATNNMDYDDAFIKLFNSGVINCDYTNLIFDFINKVAERDKKCYDVYNKLMLAQESNLKILSLLYTVFRNQLIVETSVKATVESTGLTKFAIYQANIRKGRYTKNELLDNLSLLKDLEQGIKNGTYEEPIVIDYFLSKIFIN